MCSRRQIVSIWLKVIGNITFFSSFNKPPDCQQAGCMGARRQTASYEATSLKHFKDFNLDCWRWTRTKDCAKQHLGIRLKRTNIRVQTLRIDGKFLPSSISEDARSFTNNSKCRDVFRIDTVQCFTFRLIQIYNMRIHEWKSAYARLTFQILFFMKHSRPISNQGTCVIF